MSRINKIGRKSVFVLSIFCGKSKKNAKNTLSIKNKEKMY